MRVCVVSFKECWQGPDGRWMSYGGFPVQMHGIASLFDAMTLVVVRGAARPGGMPLPPAARVVPLRAPVGDDLRRKLSVAARLPYYLTTITRAVRDADVVHTPLPGDLALLGFAVAVGMRKRLIARYGGSWVTNGQSTLAGRVTRSAMRRLGGGRNVMLAAGAAAEPPAAAVHWLFSTALTAPELAAARPTLDRGLSAPVRLVYVGRLSAEKGVAVLLDALQLLMREGAPAPLALSIVGDGGERAALEAAARPLAAHMPVTFHGQLDRARLSAELRHADVCVQPSLSEGFCKAWLDACAHGVPVLASEVGAAAAVLGTGGERGWLVPAGDPRALAAAIARVVAEPRDWPALRARCRAFAEELTIERWAQRIGQICAEQWRVSLVGGRLR